MDILVFRVHNCLTLHSVHEVMNHSDYNPIVENVVIKCMHDLEIRK